MKTQHARRPATLVLLVLLLVGLGLLIPGCGTSLGPAGAAALKSPAAVTGQAPPSWSLWPQEESDLPPDPAILFKRLPNGFRYALLKNTHPTGRVAMQLIVQAGSLDENDDQLGLAHFLEHLVFDGSTHFKPDELVAYFQKLGMSFGPDANAQTGFDETVYQLLLPKGDKSDLDDGLLVLGDFAMGALLLPAEIDRERGVVLAEMRRRDSSDYRTYVKTMAFLYPGTRPVRRLPIGTKESLERADRARIKAFYDTWYRPDNMILVVVGDMDPAEAEAAIVKTFGAFKPRMPAAPRPDPGHFEHQGLSVFFHHEPEAGKTRVNIDLARTMDPEPDTRAFRRRELLEDIAVDALQHRLDALLQKPNTPMSSAGARHYRFLEKFDILQMSAACDGEKWSAVLPLLENTLRQALIYGFDPTELDRVKQESLASLDSGVKQAATRDSDTLASQLVVFLNLRRVFQSPSQELEVMGPMVRDATPAEVNEALRRLWAPPQRQVLVTGNAAIGGPGQSAEKTIRAAYEQAARVAVAEPERLKAATFPYLPEPKAEGRIRSRRTVEDLGVTIVDFENGVRLNLKPTKFKADQVLAQLAFGRGRRDEPENAPGLALLAERVLSQSGLGGLNREELDRALSGKNTAVQFGVREDRCLLAGDSVSGEVPLLFQLLYANVLDPGFREEALSLSLGRYDQSYAQLSQSVDGLMQVSGTRFLAGGDSRFGLPSPESLRRLSLKDLRAWVEGPLKKGPLELSLVGDFNVDEVIGLAARYFGSLPARGPAEAAGTRPEPRAPRGVTLRLEAPTRIQKALVVLAYPTDGFWDIRRTRRLSMLAEVVSDRMRVVLREKMGLAYSPLAYNRPSRAFPDYGLLVALVHGAPADIDRVAETVRQIVADLVKEGVSEDENTRALKPMLTGIREQVEKNEYWLESVLAGLQQHPEQLDWSRTMLKDYSSISPGELSALAKKYLDNGQCATIILQPAGPEKTP